MSSMRKIIVLILFLLTLAFVVFSEPQGAFYEPEKDTDEIHFWGVYDLPEVYAPIITAFQKEHPNIQVVYKQFSNIEEYHQVLSRQLERGQGPDIFLFAGEDREFYRPHLNPSSADLATGFAPIIQEQLVENRLLYALPLWTDSLMLFYNKRYYKDGIAQNWYELADQTTNIGIGGLAMGRFDNLKSAWDILKTLFLQKQVLISGQADDKLFDTLEFFVRFARPQDKYFNWNEKLSKD